MTELRIAVAADIHSDERPNKWTRVVAEPPIPGPNQQPLADLSSFIASRNLRANYFFAVGDVGNQASAAGVTYGWRKAHQIAGDLGAKLVGVPGNHDVITHKFATDPRSTLKSLIPSFPTGTIVTDQHFWAHGWALIERSDHRILLLDSTRDFPSYPGNLRRSSRSWLEYEQKINRGGFLEEVEREIANALLGLGEKLNIAVVHHHPLEHQNHVWLQDQYGPMRRGGELIDLLGGTTTTGRWLIIHGHKHVPQLVSATATSTNGPIVLCGASVGAKIWDPVNTITRNQFHIITMTDEFDPEFGGLAGTVESYTWGFGTGWRVSEQMGSGLPARAGFGSSQHFRSLASKVEKALDNCDEDFMLFSDLLALVPDLPYVLPADWDLLESRLAQQGIGFSRDRDQRLVQVSRERSAS